MKVESKIVIHLKQSMLILALLVTNYIDAVHATAAHKPPKLGAQLKLEMDSDPHFLQYFCFMFGYADKLAIKEAVHSQSSLPEQSKKSLEAKKYAHFQRSFAQFQLPSNGAMAAYWYKEGIARADDDIDIAKLDGSGCDVHAELNKILKSKIYLRQREEQLPEKDAHFAEKYFYPL